jgi:hypothetical protein
LQTVIRRKANWIGYILSRNCLLKRVFKGDIEEGVKERERRGRRRKQLPDDFKEKRGIWKLKEAALDRIL